MRPIPEVQTCIDECADGTWQGAIYVGSNFAGRYIDGPTFIAVAMLVDAKIAELRATWWIPKS